MRSLGKESKPDSNFILLENVVITNEFAASVLMGRDIEL